LYARHFLAAHPNLKPQSVVWDSMDTSINEMKAFRGTLLLQGTLHKPARYKRNLGVNKFKCFYYIQYNVKLYIIHNQQFLFTILDLFPDAVL